MHLTPLRTIDLTGFTLTTSKLTRLNEIEIQIISDYLKAKSISMNQVRDSIIDYHSRGLFGEPFFFSFLLKPLSLSL